MNFDVRKPEAEIHTIQFAERDFNRSSGPCYIQGFSIERWKQRSKGENSVSITDGGDYVVISSAEHADNLIKAIEKAKELGWLK